MWETRLSAKLLKSFNTGFSEGFPISWRKVDGFVEVEAMVEARMVGLWKRDDELTSALIESVYLHSCFPELFRRQQCHKLEKEIWLRLKKLRNGLSHGFLKSMCILARYTVPCFGSTKVLIIGRVGVVIFVMPAEGGEAHANVKPRHRHS